MKEVLELAGSKPLEQGLVDFHTPEAKSKTGSLGLSSSSDAELRWAGEAPIAVWGEDEQILMSAQCLLLLWESYTLSSDTPHSNSSHDRRQDLSIHSRIFQLLPQGSPTFQDQKTPLQRGLPFLDPHDYSVWYNSFPWSVVRLSYNFFILWSLIFFHFLHSNCHTLKLHVCFFIYLSHGSSTKLYLLLGWGPCHFHPSISSVSQHCMEPGPWEALDK